MFGVRLSFLVESVGVRDLPTTAQHRLVQVESAMDACPVCYSTYSSEEPETVARELPCGHVACTQCLRDCLEDGSERRDPGQPVSKKSSGLSVSPTVS